MMIITAGVIGAGKTALAKRLSKLLGTKAFLEPVANNPILPLFYKGNQLVANGEKQTNPYTFLLQIYFLNKRFHMIKKAMSDDNNVLDRSIYEDRIFMKMNFDLGTTTQEEWDVYSDLLKNMMQELPYAAHKKAPDLMVMIHVSLETELKRIKKRGRAYEQVSTHPNLLNYYKNLQKYYAKWYQKYNYSPKLMINGDKYDFVNNKQDRKHVFNQIENKLISIGKLKKSFTTGDHLD